MQYHYEFKDRNRVVFQCQAETLTEAVEKLNFDVRLAPKPYHVCHEFLFMAVVEAWQSWLGVTWKQ